MNEQEIQEKLKFHRRNLHKIPELGFEEYKTSEYILNILKEFKDLKIHKYAGTGIVAEYRGDLSRDSYLGFRTDIDGLNLNEQTELEFKSVHEGRMHACGHDFHMSIMLTLLEYTMRVTKPKRNILFIFQPAEEARGGSLRMVNEGLFKDFEVEEVYALHNTQELLAGEISVNDHKMFAGTLEFSIILRGKGGHIAMYHKLNDLNSISAILFNMLNLISSKMIDPTHETVVSVGDIRSTCTDAPNILTKELMLKGTVRSYYKEDLEFIRKRIDKFLQGFKMAFDIDYEFNVPVSYLPVINHKIAAAKIKEAAQKADISVKEALPKMTGEDFSFMVNEAKAGAIFWLGVGYSDESKNRVLHDSSYSPDEAGLITGFKVFKNLIMF